MQKNKCRFDVIVPLLNVDIPTFSKYISYIKTNLPCKRIVVIGSSAIKDDVIKLNVSYINEDEVFPDLTIANVRKIKENISGTSQRAGWYFQQFVKMAYSMICEDDYYLIWDGDTIPIRQIDFFDDNNHPYLGFRQYEKMDECYTATQLSILPNSELRKTEKKSFIAEHLLVNVSIMRALINAITEKCEARKENFFENIMYSIPRNQINLSGFSEFECYASYVLNKYNGTYILRPWRNLRNGKVYLGNYAKDKDFQWVSECFDVITFEDFDSYWLICPLIRKIWKDVKFSTIYNFINPFYMLYYKCRLIIRDWVKV